jgi:hypothetical protein
VAAAGSKVSKLRLPVGLRGHGRSAQQCVLAADIDHGVTSVAKLAVEGGVAVAEVGRTARGGTEVDGLHVVEAEAGKRGVL